MFAKIDDYSHILEIDKNIYMFLSYWVFIIDFIIDSELFLIGLRSGETIESPFEVFILLNIMVGSINYEDFNFYQNHKAFLIHQGI